MISSKSLFASIKLPTWLWFPGRSVRCEHSLQIKYSHTQHLLPTLIFIRFRTESHRVVNWGLLLDYGFSSGAVSLIPGPSITIYMLRWKKMFLEFQSALCSSLPFFIGVGMHINFICSFIFRGLPLTHAIQEHVWIWIFRFAFAVPLKEIKVTSALCAIHCR